MGYQRRVHGDSSLESQVELTETTWTRPPTMKTVNCNYDVSLEEFGEKVKMVVKGQSVTVSGPRGTLHRDFSHMKNMAVGVTSGFRYKMRTVYAHFPINMIVKD